MGISRNIAGEIYDIHKNKATIGMKESPEVIYNLNNLELVTNLFGSGDSIFIKIKTSNEKLDFISVSQFDIPGLSHLLSDLDRCLKYLKTYNYVSNLKLVVEDNVCVIKFNDKDYKLNIKRLGEVGPYALDNPKIMEPIVKNITQISKDLNVIDNVVRTITEIGVEIWNDDIFALGDWLEDPIIFKHGVSKENKRYLQRSIGNLAIQVNLDSDNIHDFDNILIYLVEIESQPWFNKVSEIANDRFFNRVKVITDGDITYIEKFDHGRTTYNIESFIQEFTIQNPEMVKLYGKDVLSKMHLSDYEFLQTGKFTNGVWNLDSCYVYRLGSKCRILIKYPIGDNIWGIKDVDSLNRIKKHILDLSYSLHYNKKDIKRISKVYKGDRVDLLDLDGEITNYLVNGIDFDTLDGLKILYYRRMFKWI